MKNLKRMILIAAVLIVAILAVGCKWMDRRLAIDTDQRQVVTAQAAYDYAYAQKAKFVEDMKKELAGIQKDLDQLSAKVDSSDSSVKVDAKAKLEAARLKWVQAKTRLDQAEGATESTWSDVKNGFKRAYDELMNSFEQTRQWLSNKIAP